MPRLTEQEQQEIIRYLEAARKANSLDGCGEQLEHDSWVEEIIRFGDRVLLSVAQAQLDHILNQPWLDKPDGEGWWWRKNQLGRLSCDYFNDVSVETWEFYGSGKYQRAIVPNIA